MITMNQKGKKTSESLTCRFCTNNLPETQKHLEICDGTMFEGQWGNGKSDFLEEDDTEDDSEDGYYNLNSRGSST